VPSLDDPDDLHALVEGARARGVPLSGEDAALVVRTMSEVVAGGLVATASGGAAPTPEAVRRLQAAGHAHLGPREVLSTWMAWLALGGGPVH